MNKIKYSIIFQEIFHISFITYMVLLLVETIKSGFVSYFFNLQLLLVLVLLSGIGMEWYKNERIKKFEKETYPHKLRLQLLIACSLGGGILVYYKTQDLGMLAFILSIVSMLLIFLLSFIIASDSP